MPTDTAVFQSTCVKYRSSRCGANDIVIMNNLGAHKNNATLALITQAGAEIRFLPAYSPDVNLIEMMWSKVKALFRKPRLALTTTFWRPSPLPKTPSAGLLQVAMTLFEML